MDATLEVLPRSRNGVMAEGCWPRAELNYQGRVFATWPFAHFVPCIVAFAVHPKRETLSHLHVYNRRQVRNHHHLYNPVRPRCRIRLQVDPGPGPGSESTQSSSSPPVRVLVARALRAAAARRCTQSSSSPPVTARSGSRGGCGWAMAMAKGTGGGQRRTTCGPPPGRLRAPQTQGTLMTNNY